MYRSLTTLSRWMAVTGGFVLIALIALVCLSVLGRGINTFLYGDMMQGSAKGLADALLATGVGPILGDFEVVEAGIAFAIFAFLPLCQITQSHATVDVFTAMMSERVNRMLALFSDMLFFGVLALIAWRLGDGMMSKFGNGETTFLIQFPVWWGYAACMVPAVLAVIVAGYMAVTRVREVATGTPILPLAAGADH